MTTFKNNPKYAELLYVYLDAAFREDTPLSVPHVLRSFCWLFKGGSLQDATMSTRLKPAVSSHRYPAGMSAEIANQWPNGEDARALSQILAQRRASGKLKSRGVMSRLGTYQLLVSKFGEPMGDVRIMTGMCAVYHMFGRLWEWAPRCEQSRTVESMQMYIRELTLASAQVSRVHVPTAEAARIKLVELLRRGRFAGLMQVVLDLKAVMRASTGPLARRLARMTGLNEREKWEPLMGLEDIKAKGLSDPGEDLQYVRMTLGPLRLRVTQGLVVYGVGELRFAMGRSDLERLHQVMMSAVSALFGVTAQAVVGTERQKTKSLEAVEVAERNIQRIVDSSRKVRLGDEVLVCKGYRRVYTAHLAVLAGKMCSDERDTLVREAHETAGPGVLDVDGMLSDLRKLDAASSLNVAKMFKICPAPDVCPAHAMMDRIKQIGNGNVVDPAIMPMFKEELRTQILRAFVRSTEKRLELRFAGVEPTWYHEYKKGNLDEVPSSEIHTYLKWEGVGEMPDVSPHDPANWKDSGLGADTIKDSMRPGGLGNKSNMMTRLVFDDTCPMPGTQKLNDEHVIKFFVKSEGHKDPARGIFSANLQDRQAQSWMERAVESIAKSHPSFMIGADISTKDAKVAQLVEVPREAGKVALYYSFDISGWSAKMPAEPQLISHSIWAELFGGHLFRTAHLLNTDAHIYLDIDGYRGWFKNTHANLEGFNGKEMTMVLVALLSLSVRVWREKVVEAGVMDRPAADTTVALLFAYIDDGLCRIDLPRDKALAAFDIYKRTVNETFGRCGFTVEVSKCFPSDRFAIFLNEVYVAGRHVVHGVRAAMAISSEPTERHTSLVERVTTVSNGCRGAVLAGLNPLSATFLMGYHMYLHFLEWVTVRDPVVLAGWALCPRSWGGLGMPNMLQLGMSGSGSAFEEGVSTLQAYAKMSTAIRKAFVSLCKDQLADRTHVGVLTAPLSGRMKRGYMVDSRVPTAVRKGLLAALDAGRLSTYATRLLQYSDPDEFADYAEAVVALDDNEVIQEQMLDNLAEAHPHDIFAAFARRMEKSMTVLSLVGSEKFGEMIAANRAEARESVQVFRARVLS